MFKFTFFIKFLIFSLTNFSFIFLFKNFFFLKNFIFLFFFLYFLLNFYFYFSTFYQFSKYTSFVKFFWQRSFILFWLLEFFLFFIFIYVYLFCPSETRYFFDFIKNTKVDLSVNKDFILNLILITACFFSLSAFFKFKKNSSSFFPLNSFCFLIIFSFIFFSEFFFFKNTINQFNFFFYKKQFLYQQELLNFGFFLSNNFICVQKPSSSIFLFLIFLRFLHVVFIFFLTLFAFLKFFKSLKSYESLSVIATNFNYILVFYILNFLVVFKPLIQFFFLKNYFFNFNLSSTNQFFIFIIEVFINLF